VRIVIPTHQPGSWFDSTIRSIADQDYPNLSVTLVHGVGEGELLERHRSIIERLELIEAPDDSGFGAKVNLAVIAAEEQFVLICHDDVAFQEGAVSALVRERLRRDDSRTIVAPKLVDWNDQRLLMPGGFDADQFGDTTALVKPGDLDQDPATSIRVNRTGSQRCSVHRRRHCSSIVSSSATLENSTS